MSRFLSTLSLRRATCTSSFSIFWICHFYPRSPCGERRSGRPGTRRRDAISIHALLAESDVNWFDLWGWAEYFYPRSPCGERRIEPIFGKINTNFYPRSPCGERPSVIKKPLQGFNFYPRSPCGERRRPNALKSRR